MRVWLRNSSCCISVFHRLVKDSLNDRRINRCKNSRKNSRINRRKYASLRVLVLLPLFAFSPLQLTDPPVDYILVNQSFRFHGLLNNCIDLKGDFQSVTIPLKRAGRLFLIEARIGDQTGNFVFDTGASTLVLNRTYFRKDLVLVDEPAGGVTGNVEKVYQTRVARVDLPELCFENIVADVINLGHIENRRGVKILGLFGMCLFRNLEMVIDLKRSELQLYRIDKLGKRISTTPDTLKTDLTCPIKEAGGVIFLQGTMGGRNLDFCLDTGAEANVLSSSASKKVLSTVTITRRSDLTGSGSDQIEVLYGTMNDFFLGKQPLHPMKTMITGMEALALAYNYPLSGILGYDFFEKGIVCINLVKKELGMCLVREVAQ
jgi:predicted aspartyl protease